MTTATADPQAAASRRAARRAAVAQVSAPAGGLEELEPDPAALDRAQAEAHQRTAPSRTGSPAMDAMEPFEDMIVTEADTEIVLPLIEGAIVVYIGAGRKHSKGLRGVMQVEDLEIEPEERDPKTGKILKPSVVDQIKTPQKVGPGATINTYDFSTHDSRGRLILIHLMPSVQTFVDEDRVTQRRAVPMELRGKPFVLCEHPEHLRWFHLRRGEGRDKAKEYRVLVPARVRPAFMRFMNDPDRKIGRERAEEEYTLGGPSAKR